MRATLQCRNSVFPRRPSVWVRDWIGKWCRPSLLVGDATSSSYRHLKLRLLQSTSSDSQPLLGQNEIRNGPDKPRWFPTVNQKPLQHLLSSRKTHYLILVLVALDVSALLGNIFLELVACDKTHEPPAWNTSLREALTAAGLVFSSLFLLELALCIIAFGTGYFADWFHCVDAAVIIASFVIDLLSHGIVEDIASLVIIFRLFRLVKLVEEMSLGASVRMESMEEELERLQDENSELKTRLRRRGEEVV